MADEITLRCNLTVDNIVKLNSDLKTQRIDQANVGGGGPAIITVPTTAAGEQVDLTTQLDITTPGICVIKNLDSTNFVEAGVQVGGTFYALIKLKATEGYVFRLNTTNDLYLRANTASCKVLCSVYED